MTQLNWQTEQDLRALLCELVSWKSMSRTDGERDFPYKAHAKLQHIPYFQEHPEHLALVDADHHRKLLTALYKHENATKTIVLISHFDTVNTEEYGDLEALAFEPEMLTQALLERTEELPEDARRDLLSGDYLFGRGTMDMKMGLALHMQLIEKAAAEKWPINLVLLTVPDEEVSSVGMREAVPHLITLKEKHQLDYFLFLNGEPVFAQEPGDKKTYIYSGTIGKIMPSALVYGMETHVGEPLSGVTANYFASFLTKEMEFTDQFREAFEEEQTPIPVSLMQKDLKMEYSVQTPYRAALMWNVFTFKQNAGDIMQTFEKVANVAAKEANEHYTRICARENVAPVGKLEVIRYEKLVEYAKDKFGEAAVTRMVEDVCRYAEGDDRDKSFKIVDKLMIECQELAPAYVIFYAPPYYPAVNSSDEAVIQDATAFIQQEAKEAFDLTVNRIHYFNGICDLSYVNYADTRGGWEHFENNTPVWNLSYTIPFKEMAQLQAPVFNVGPFGKDPHKRTERLHINSAFVETPYLLEKLIRNWC
ncbi:M20/M25/M40 family metallo-hydrolase [Paenisporosarcina cavernae]|uniref:M20/M25/M40 family metallo-hydrolase n=1 Tax=Paenisporosarcina cavernae TaxID=2320858 RepID=A0A385YT75_9BACL|nr:M20/M25/M40 family metallo-hydrolase [Paenisporosarcina cavernae]AYC28888.1 M20/M25/M40 family metallo-hydrolase [Paenisporosarcina cavernae]